MEELTRFVGDTVAAKKYREWYNAARKECDSIIYTSEFCSHSDYAEGDMAGYSWANYFCLEPIINPEVVNEGCKRLRKLYFSQGTVPKKLGRWHFYTCDHWGGTEIACGNPDTAMTLFKLDYDFYHSARPQMVFWQDLWGVNNIYSSYMTAPSAWRSYFQMTGYLLDNAHQRLWVRPRIPKDMNQQIVNAPLLHPKCWGNLNYDGRLTDISDQSLKRTQRLSVTFDSIITIKELMLNNTTGQENPCVHISIGSSVIDNFTCTTEGAGLEKNIRVTFANPVQIGPCGLLAEVYMTQISVSRSTSPSPHVPVLSINSSVIAEGIPIQYTVDAAGPITIDLMTLNGAKISTILQKSIEKPGSYNCFLKNRTMSSGVLSQRLMIVRLSTRSGSVCKLVSSVVK
jgi:hypothetical protein